MAVKDAGVVSSQELHAFGNFLKKSEDDMVALIRGIVNEVYRVNEGWDDKVNQEFTIEFNTYIDQILKLVELLDNHSRFVHKKATAIEQYNNIR
jgi:uncharacterized protein YukE